MKGGCSGPWNIGERAKYGVVQLRGNQEFTYDDNMWLVQSGKTNDWVSISSPGLVYRLGDPKNNAIEAGYDVNVIRYFQQTGEDGEEHNPYFQATFGFGKTRLNFVDTMNIVQGGDNRVGGNETTARVKKLQNDGTVSSETQISDRFALGLHAHCLYYDPQGGLLQRTQIDGGTTVFYKAFAKVDVYTELNGGHVDVRQGGQENFMQGKVGYRGDLTPKLSGRFDVGGEYRASSLSWVPDQTTPVISGGMTHKCTDDFSVGVRSSRSINNSITTSGQTYVSSLVGLKLDYQFGPFLKSESKTRKMSFGLDFSYENDSFELPTGNQAQDLDLYTVAPSLEVRIQEYWKVYLVYRYQDNESNLSGGNYKNNRLSLGTSVLF
ncbi:MAG: outer membrane beta-barrel protein [Verrucomicrobiae bacterium]|nr:outer membrane beta-barrel protein [Verrucomicrobiae bacterium]